MGPGAGVVGMEDGDLGVAQAAHRAHRVPGAKVRGVEPLVIADHELPAPSARRGRDLLGLLQAVGHRLLDEEVLVAPDQVEEGVAVTARGEDQEGVEIRPAEQLAVVLDPRGDVVAIAHRVQRLLADVGEGGDREQVRPLGQRGQMHHLRDAADADDADAQGRHQRAPRAAGDHFPQQAVGVLQRVVEAEQGAEGRGDVLGPDGRVVRCPGRMPGPMNTTGTWRSYSWAVPWPVPPA